MKRLLVCAIMPVVLLACSKEPDQPAVAPASPTSADTASPSASTSREPASQAAAPAGARAPASGLPAAPSASTHVVAKGDTLSAIARARGMSAEDLARWNDIDDPRRLRIGQQLRLTAPGS